MDYCLQYLVSAVTGVEEFTITRSKIRGWQVDYREMCQEMNEIEIKIKGFELMISGAKMLGIDPPDEPTPTAKEKK